jgi:hypothetical protein
MFNRYNFLVVLGLALLLNAPGYVKAEPPDKNFTPPAPQAASQANKPEPATKSVKIYTPAERQAYQKKMGRDIQELQQNVDKLKVKARTVPQQKKRTVLRASVDLQRRFNYAKQKLAALEAAPEKNWSSLKAEMDKTMTNLTQAVNAFEARL